MLFCCLSALLQGQNLKSDIASINSAYRRADKLSFVFELNMFETYQSQQVYYTQAGVVQKSGKSTYQKFDDTECINTPQYSVIIDKEEKEVVYAPKKITFNHDDPGLAISLDSLLLFCRAHQFKKESEKLYSYGFDMTEAYPDYNRVVVYFNPNTFMVQKLVFFCEEDDISTDNQEEHLSKARIEINYKNIDTSPSLNDKDFSYEKYLVKSGEKFQLKPELKSYHLTVLSF